MKILFAENAWQDYLFWQQPDEKLLHRINDLIKDIQRQPFRGLGKPEPLKGNLAGYWSRRIDTQHRLVYKVEKGVIAIAQCRYHYQ